MKATGEGRADGPGGFVNTGVIGGGVTLAAPRPAVSGYLHQVRRLSAARFQGRAAELAAMATFCTAEAADTGAEGRWWRWHAPAWAGKTALMAEFVLHPPPGVVVVSFFITARLAGQNNRAAFGEVVLRQLYTLLDEEEPPVTEHTRDEVLLHALERVAARCAGNGRRLVLLVDGLDEDRGAAAGGHSIAALLPAVPPHGSRIIVAGRPHPPIPNDVPGHHPLRNAAIDHDLVRSPHAEAVRAEAENSLDALLESGGLACELLGLVAAAGGGLSADDLAELTGSRPVRVRRTLAGVTGRVFLTSPLVWAAEGEVYLLGHEEIQTAALEMLTDGELTGYRDRLHTWADTCRGAGWPESTPEYLLRGYTELLRSTGDVHRLATMATDPLRHERLWKTTGSDLEALTEISAAFGLLQDLTGPEGPDVGTAVRLAIRRDALYGLADSLPTDVIIAWALAGHVDRAVSLALAHSSPKRAQVLGGAAEVLAESGRHSAADAFAEAALGTTGGPSAPDGLLPLPLALLMALARTGRLEPAGLLDPELLQSIDAVMFPWVIRPLAVAGEWEGVRHATATVRRRAEELADKAKSASALLATAQALVDVGMPEAAVDAVGRALETARAMPRETAPTWHFSAAAHVLNQVGRQECALHVAEEAAEMARAARAGGLPSDARDTACALAWAGRHERARELVGALSPRDGRSVGFGWLAGIAVDCGEFAEAWQCIEETDEDQRPDLLGDLSIALARGGRYEEAVRGARAITSDAVRAKTLASVAETLAEAGRWGEACTLAGQAAEAARESPAATRRSAALAAAARSMAAAREAGRATELCVEAAEAARTGLSVDKRIKELTVLARSLAGADRPGIAGRLVDTALRLSDLLTDAGARFTASLALVRAMADTGRRDQAADIVVRMEEAAQVLDRSDVQGNTVTSLCEAWALAGRHQEAADTAHSVDDESQRVAVLSRVAESTLAAGDAERAPRVAAQAADIACAIEDDAIRSSALRQVTVTMARCEAFDRAQGLVRLVSQASDRLPALAVLAEKLVGAARHAEAATCAAEAEEALRTEPAAAQEGMRHAVVHALAVVGEEERATALARTMTPTAVRQGALLGVAAASRDAPYGRRLLIEALCLGPWRPGLDAMQVLAPEALEAAAECLLTRDDQGTEYGR